MNYLPQRILAALILCAGTTSIMAQKPLKDQSTSSCKNIFVVNTTKPTGPGSLARAVEKACAKPEVPSKIIFRIPRSDAGFNPATGTFVIELNAPLEICSNTLIDGFSQKCSSANTQPLANPDDSLLKIEIQLRSLLGKSKQAIASGFDTLVFKEDTTGSRLRGLIVHGSGESSSAAAIRILGNNNVVEGCHVGVLAGGEVLDSTITALAIEGTGNIIGDDTFVPGSVEAPRPASRMIIGGRGFSSATTPAILILGRGTRLINGQLGIQKSGNAILDGIATTGLTASIPGIFSPAEAFEEDNDLRIDTFAAAGSSDTIFNLTEFATAVINNVSAGTNLNSTVAFGGGTGLVALNPVLIDESAVGILLGNISITNSVFAGLNLGLALGRSTSGMEALDTFGLLGANIENSFIGTNRELVALPNINGAASRNIAILKVTGSIIAHHTDSITGIGWQHGALDSVLSSNTATFDSNIFNNNHFGLNILGFEVATISGNTFEFSKWGITFKDDNNGNITIDSDNIFDGIELGDMYSYTVKPPVVI
jgi:hypothetical protein